MNIWWLVLHFIIAYLAASIAIYQFFKKPKKSTSENQDIGLVKLRDIGILSNTELEEIIKIYNDKSSNSENYKQYKKYEKVLDELKEIRYYNDEQYYNKIAKLKQYFEVD